MAVYQNDTEYDIYHSTSACAFRRKKVQSEHFDSSINFQGVVCVLCECYIT